MLIWLGLLIWPIPSATWVPLWSPNRYPPTIHGKSKIKDTTDQCFIVICIITMQPLMDVIDFFRHCYPEPLIHPIASLPLNDTMIVSISNQDCFIVVHEKIVRQTKLNSPNTAPVTWKNSYSILWRCRILWNIPYH